MGRRNKSYSKDLHQQAYERLNSMQAFGESRRTAKVEGADRDKIFSFNTYKSYWKHTKYFIKYIKEHHPECTTLKKARKYVGEWLQDGVDRGLSAWTIGVQRSAMGKLYGIAPDDEDFFKAPKKQRENSKRSRGVRVRDKHFSKTNNDGLIKFCQGTGLRRKELQELRGKDLMTRAQIETEISPMVGGEQESQQLIDYLLGEYEEDTDKLWQSNIFGKSLYELVSEGVTAKIMRMPDDARQKLTKTLGRMINENTGGMICILL